MQYDQSQGLIDALDKVGATAQVAAVGLQVKLDKAASRVGDALDDNVRRLIESLDRSSSAANRSANALMRATWALAILTGVLVVITALPYIIGPAR